jgi:hypothetical protein
MSAGREKILWCDDVYVKQDCLCCQYADGWIVKYPLANIFQWSHKHSFHTGTGRADKVGG